MRSIRHPLSGALYDLQDDGTVRVEKDGKVGLFSKDGVYLSGDVYQADPHLCVWIGGRSVRSGRRRLVPDSPNGNE